MMATKTRDKPHNIPCMYLLYSLDEYKCWLEECYVVRTTTMQKNLLVGWCLKSIQTPTTYGKERRQNDGGNDTTASTTTTTTTTITIDCNVRYGYVQTYAVTYVRVCVCASIGTCILFHPKESF